MTDFQRQPIRQHQSVGEQLRHARETAGLAVAEVAMHIKVPQHHLEALERGRYNDLPSPVYIKNYLRQYCRAVGIAWERIQPQYEQEVQSYAGIPKASYEQQGNGLRKQHRVLTSGLHERRPLVIPRLLKAGLWSIVVVLLVLYFLWEIVQFISPPQLVVDQPARDMIVYEPRLLVQGKSEPESIVEVNGQSISVNPDGMFSETIFLQQGLNTIRITARSKRSQERAEIRNVLYSSEPNPESNPEAQQP